MRKIFVLIIIPFLFILLSCSNKEPAINKIEDIKIEEQMIKSYQEGLNALELGDAIKAAEKFSEAEIFFPQSIWAPRSALMAAYSYYIYGLYEETIYELERYFRVYPLHERKGYAYYLIALSYYEQIIDEKKDQDPILKSKKYFELLLKDYPKSEFAADANYKLDLIEDILASKEMYLGRYYLEKEKWIPAINRFKIVINDYGRTIYVEEALHRLVEVHYKIGLVDESKKYANLLGYNYQSSEWYKKTYKIFNKDYKPIKKNNKTDSSLIKKLKSIITN